MMDELKDKEHLEDNQLVNQEEQATGPAPEVAAEVVAEPAIEEKMAALEDKHLRLVAEFDNYRKRMAKERLELIAVANEDLLQGLLPVLDDMERAVKAMQSSDDAAAIREGVLLIQDKLLKYLESKGLKQFDATGATLNTDEHDAVTKFPAPTEEQKGKVIDVIQRGYTLHGKVIRFAKVVVGE